VADTLKAASTVLGAPMPDCYGIQGPSRDARPPRRQHQIRTWAASTVTYLCDAPFIWAGCSEVKAGAICSS
jgi:hypothetical protein